MAVPATFASITNVQLCNSGTIKSCAVSERVCMQKESVLRRRWAFLRIVSLSAILNIALSAYAADVLLHNQQEAVVVHSHDGSYEIVDDIHHQLLIHARVGAVVNHKWIRPGDYPAHEIKEGSFTDALGSGRKVEVICKGISSLPDLIYIIRLYDNLPWGDIQVTLQNQTAQSATVQMIRPVEGLGISPVHTGSTERNDRVLSDSFSEDWPPMKIQDLAHAQDGMLRAVGSQLIYNQESKESLFFGALSSEYFLTIMHLKPGVSASASDKISSYTVDSTGTTEIQATDPESGLKDGPAKNLVELNLPLLPGATMHSELLMFASGDNYFSILDNYGSAVRILHHSRVHSDNLLGWWSWTAFYSDITEGNTWTNALWLAQHLKTFGYDYFHLDLGYAYARGEYATPNIAQFPEGLSPLVRKVCSLGLKMGFWTAPFEVSDRSWVYEHHKDWLVHNAAGEVIPIGIGEEAGLEKLFVLDTTNPGAQDYLRQTFRTLAKDWGAQYIKLDFMDNTAIEGYYYRPNTTALQAQRIGLEIIRDAVGPEVLLDKDGSPMLNAVGYVDEGRVSQDTGHLFQRSKEAAPGIAARYYMNRNFFINDPDAFTVSRQMIEERHIQAPLTLNEAQVSIALAALSGGMFELGDDLPTLGKSADRIALVTNPDLLQMVKLGRAARPLDLLTYRPEDEQPSIFYLREDQHQSILAIFNWTEQVRSHELKLTDLGLSSDYHYLLRDVFQPEKQLSVGGRTLRIENQPAHSVRLIKVINSDIPATAPSISLDVSEKGKVGENLHFAGSATHSEVPVLRYHWDFGDGTGSDGAEVTHTYTLAGSYTIHLRVEGIDGVPYQKEFTVIIKGLTPPPVPRR